MHCTVKSSKYKTIIEFWRHGWYIKARTVDYVSELDDLNDHDGVVLCQGGCLRGDVIKFYDEWSQEQFQAICKDWWRKYARKID